MPCQHKRRYRQLAAGNFSRDDGAVSGADIVKAVAELRLHAKIYALGPHRSVDKRLGVGSRIKPYGQRYIRHESAPSPVVP